MRNKRLIILFCILFAVTTLIVLSSAVFSVRFVYAYCANDDKDPELNEQVADFNINEIKAGRSIFLLSEKKIIEAVENKLPQVEVINIERKFPDRVYINFRKLFPYYAIAAGDKTLLAGYDGKILSTTENPDDYIKFTTLGAPNETSTGKRAFDAGSTEGKFIAKFSETIDKMQILEYTSLQKKMEIFESIDISGISSSEFFVKMRTGTEITFFGTLDDLEAELRVAVTTYFSKSNDYMNSKLTVFKNYQKQKYEVTVGDKNN